MSRVPRIRFKGFEEDWEQRKLEYYLEVSEEKNLSNEYTKENVLSVSGDVGIVNQIEFQGRSFAGILVNNYGVVKTGYVVYTKSPLKNNPYGIIKANKGRNGIVSTLYSIYKPKLNVNSNFIQIYFEQNARMNNYMQPLVNKGAKNDMKISSENALKGNVIFPIRKEQDIIVDLFFKIDHLITLHQRKLEKLKIIKKSMLENLFPQNGEKTPKIRFSGFTEDWEQRKLSEIALRVSNLRLSSSDLPCVEYEDVVSEAGILNNDIRSKKVVKAGILFDDTHVLYGKLRPYLHNWLCPDFSGVAVGDWWVLKPCYVAREFIYRIIQTKRFDNATNQSSGSKMPRADWNLVSNTEFMISSDSSEQEKIGLYFKKLDHYITLHQSKLEKLQKIKKSMLESMFV